MVRQQGEQWGAVSMRVAEGSGMASGMVMCWVGLVFACPDGISDVQGGVVTWWCRLVSMGCNGGMVVTKGEWHGVALVKGEGWQGQAWVPGCSGSQG